MIGTGSPTRQLAINGSELREAQSYQKKPDDADAASLASNDDERALNFEYIRNVILQFLEHKEMRVSGTYLRWCSELSVFVAAASGISTRGDITVHTGRDQAPVGKGICVRRRPWRASLDVKLVNVAIWSEVKEEQRIRAHGLPFANAN